MGGKSHADNSQVVQEQQAEAAQAAAKEAARQQRLTQGLASIKQAFEGSPVMASNTSNFDWSGFKADPNTGQYSAPAGYTTALVAKPASAGASGKPAGPSRVNDVVSVNANALTGGGRGVQQTAPVASNPAAGGGYEMALKDASGKIYYPGDATPVTTQVDTGQTTGGFDDAFYNKYKQGVLDYYMPQVDKQYKDARDELTYRLARSGNVTSSAGNTDVADLAAQNDLNQANVRNQADTAEGDLRSQVASERAKATSQLYATEDPEVAANTALSSVRDISLKQPDMSPLGAIFNVATIGGANILKGYQSQQLADAYRTALSSGSGRNQVVKGV